MRCNDRANLIFLLWLSPDPGESQSVGSPGDPIHSHLSSGSLKLIPDLSVLYINHMLK